MDETWYEAQKEIASFTTVVVVDAEAHSALSHFWVKNRKVII